MPSEELDPSAECEAAGLLVIRENWRFLGVQTKTILMQSGYFTATGGRLEVDRWSRSDSEDIGRLEQSLGVLRLCVKATIPSREKLGAKESQIPREALADIPSACLELLAFPEWRDPRFLRLALCAVVANQVATSLALVGPERKSRMGFGCLGAAFAFVLILLAPVAAGFALVSAAQHDVAGTVLSLYALAVAVWPVFYLKDKEAGKHTTVAEREYLAWSNFNYMQRIGALGAGARFYLEQMAAKGVTVPSVALDLCELLQARAACIDVPPG